MMSVFLQTHSISLGSETRSTEATGHLSSAMLSMLVDQYFLKHTCRSWPSLLRGIQASIIYDASFFFKQLF